MGICPIEKCLSKNLRWGNSRRKKVREPNAFVSICFRKFSKVSKVRTWFLTPKNLVNPGESLNLLTIWAVLSTCRLPVPAVGVVSEVLSSDSRTFIKLWTVVVLKLIKSCDKNGKFLTHPCSHRTTDFSHRRRDRPAILAVNKTKTIRGRNSFIKSSKVTFHSEISVSSYVST